MGSAIRPYDFEPVYSEWSIIESTESDTKTEFINTDNNQHRVRAVSWCFRLVFIWAMPTAIECQCCCELSRVTEMINSLGCIGECITNA